MAIYKEFSPSDIKQDRDVLDQVIDILQNDISSSSTRKKSQYYVTGGVGPGITSSNWQTVFDQDFTLQTANPVFDVLFGLSPNSGLVTGSVSNIDSTTGFYSFPSQSVMMREKMDNYQELASILLGGKTKEFQLSSGSYIREPLFIAIKRLMARDRIKRETLGLRLFTSASHLNGPPSGAKIFTDVGSAANKELSFGGQVSTIVDSSNTAIPVGLFYLDRGVVVLDTQKVFDTNTVMSGTIKSMCVAGKQAFTGSMNQLFVSGCMDDVLDHVCSVHFSSSNQTAMTYMNETIINSTIYFCNFGPDEFNYSSNPTYVDANNRIVVIDPGQEESQKPFTYVTGIVGCDAHGNALWNAKLSRPALKDSQRAFTVKVRTDF